MPTTELTNYRAPDHPAVIFGIRMRKKSDGPIAEGKAEIPRAWERRAACRATKCHEQVQIDHFRQWHLTDVTGRADDVRSSGGYCCKSLFRVKYENSKDR